MAKFKIWCLPVPSSNNIAKLYFYAFTFVSFVSTLFILSIIALDKQTISYISEVSIESKHYSNIHNEYFVKRKRNNSILEYSIIEKREAIKEMMKHAWNCYAKYAWGDNELQPLSESGSVTSRIFGNAKFGVTIVDALDTLLIMNMNSEYEKGRQWIAKNLNLDNVYESVSVFEITIRIVGGLLSCYALTNDTMFLNKAQQVAEKLMPAFNTNTGIPKSKIRLNSKTTTINFRLYTFETSIADAGSLHLEFTYLADLTNNRTYKSRVNKARRAIIFGKDIHVGLFPNFISTDTGMWTTDEISIGGNADSFYEYLLKSWIQSDRKMKRAKVLTLQAMKQVEKRLLKRSKGGLHYLAEYGASVDAMSHLACFSGGWFALAADTMLGTRTERFKFLASELTKTCRESYKRAATGLGPEVFIFDENNEAISQYDVQSFYILRPEVVESYFYLWRTTKEQKYRDWAWDVVLALQKYCRTNSGFSGIKDVYDVNTQKDDVQQSYFLSETLKYLYLIFSDDLLPLENWVFNTEGHPLPIKGRNSAYQ